MMWKYWPAGLLSNNWDLSAFTSVRELQNAICYDSYHSLLSYSWPDLLIYRTRLAPISIFICNSSISSGTIEGVELGGNRIAE